MAATICIVEDDKTLCQVLEELINEAEEFRCLGAYQWAEHALEAIPRKHPDIVVVDLILPRMRGTECIWRLKQRLPSLRALAMTGHSAEQLLFDALASGADGYLQKPCSTEVFLQALRDLRDGKIPLTQRACEVILAHFRHHGPKTFLLSLLTKQERRILTSLADGLSNEQVAKRLGIALSTVKTHLHHIYTKLDLHNRTAAARLIRRS